MNTAEKEVSGKFTEKVTGIIAVNTIQFSCTGLLVFYGYILTTA